jgi:hypothetical protein
VVYYKNRADESTIKTLYKVWSHGQFWVTPESINDDAYLKYRWEADGTKDVLFFLIAVVPNKETFFGSIEFKHVADKDDAILMDSINTYIAGVRDLFERRGYKRIH